jgi:hypothetical protein
LEIDMPQGDGTYDPMPKPPPPPPPPAPKPTVWGAWLPDEPLTYPVMFGDGRPVTEADLAP